MSQVLSQLNELFITENLTDKDMLNYAFVVYDKLAENKLVMTQLDNNTREQAMLGDFTKAIDDAVIDSNEAHKEMMMQYLSSPDVARGFAHLMYDIAKMRRELTHE
jgi:type I restriction enzyme R subunit